MPVALRSPVCVWPLLRQLEQTNRVPHRLREMVPSGGWWMEERPHGGQLHLTPQVTRLSVLLAPPL